MHCDAQNWSTAVAEYWEDNRLEYRDVQPRDRADAERDLSSGDQRVIADALVAIAFYEQDRAWVEATCVEFLNHGDDDVRRVAATCLGHIARIDGAITAAAIEALKQAQSDPEIKSEATDALEDVWQFAHALKRE
jgi:hypothetical protein